MRRCIGIVGWLLIGLSPLYAQAPARPNVVLIITDDMGWADIGSYGATDARTPNVDSLARDGVKLTDFYANGTVCTPTRAALISGRYQQRYGFEAPLPNEGATGSERGLIADGRSLPRLLKNNGYATALVGKWHLGYSTEQSPNAHGFDYFFGLKSGYHDYYTHNGGNGKPDLWENERPIEVPGYITDLITERAVKIHRAARWRAVLHRRRLQRASLALPGTRQAIGRAGQRSTCDAERRADQHAEPNMSPWSSGWIAASATCSERWSASASPTTRSSSSPMTTAESGCRTTGRC